MTLLLRKIRQSRWYPPSDPSWLPAGEVQADPLADLTTEGGQLSVWVIGSDRSNLDRVLAALAGNRDTLSHIDYIVFDEAVVAALNLRSEESPGNSPDDLANKTWHRNLVELSAGRLALLLRDMYRSCEKTRVPLKKVAQLLGNAVASKWLDPSRLNKPLHDKIISGALADRSEPS